MRNDMYPNVRDTTVNCKRSRLVVDQGGGCIIAARPHRCMITPIHITKCIIPPRGVLFSLYTKETYTSPFRSQCMGAFNVGWGVWSHPHYSSSYATPTTPGHPKLGQTTR